MMAMSFWCPPAACLNKGAPVVRLPKVTVRNVQACFCAALLCAAVLLPRTGIAQAIEDTPVFRFGVSTGLVAHDNRGLDVDSAGSTFEYFTRLDFTTTFATPIQQFEVSGNLSLRNVNGAERETLDSGLVEPNLRLSYARQARDAQISVNLRYNEIDVSSSNLIDVIGIPDPQLVTEQVTRRSTVFNTELELRRRAPFGVTLSGGYTGLRHGDTLSTSLNDQDRFFVRSRFRLDLNPTTQAIIDLRYSTFEDLSNAEGVRETYQLDSSLRQNLTNGDASLLFGATSTEDGERYTLSVGRSLETPLWSASGTLGVTNDIQGDLLPNINLSLERNLLNGSLSASLSQRVTSGIDDNEQQITSISLGYNTQLNALTSFRANLSFNETDDTADSASSSFGTAGIGLQRSLTRDVSLDMDLTHRVSKNDVGLRARDNRLSITLRRDLTRKR